MPNNCLSVLYKRIIQVENKNVGLKVGGHKHTIAPPIKKVGGHMPPLPPPPRFLRQCTHTHIHIYIQWRRKVPKSGGGGAHRHVIYVPSIKNQYKRVVFGYMVIY